MNCRDVREVAESFLSGELQTETNHEILRHLETCPTCRANIEARRRLRDSLRGAFERAPELQPDADFADRLRGQLRETARSRSASTFSVRWFAIAAGILVAAGITAVMLMNRSISPTDALARDAIGDHQNCALKFRLEQQPVPLEEAAQRFDRTYRLLLSAPPDEIPTPDGPARVVARHSCAFRNRRFGHVVLKYRDHVVSLLMTADEDATGAGIPHVIGRPTSGLSVVSVNGAHHAILLVSDLDSAALTELFRAVSLPLVTRLESGLFPIDRGALAAVFGSPSDR